MFSALKKLAAGNNKNEANGKSSTGGQQAMHASLQKKFAKGDKIGPQRKSCLSG